MEKFNTHGGYFSPQGYFKVNEGGSHEENPNGGVQVGVDPQGVPNMLEEGEPVYNDYVFSDNIVADKDILKKHNIPLKYAGKLYSKIADSIVDEAEERPLDAISNNGLEAMLTRLADAQEEQKAEKQRKELEKELESMSPEELDQLEAMLAQQDMQEQQPMVEQPVEQVPEGVMPQQVVPEEQMAIGQQVQPAEQQPMMPMACGGHMKACGGTLMRKYEPGGLLTDPPVISPYNVGTQGVARDATMVAGNPMFVNMPEVREFTPEEINRAQEQQRFENNVMSFMPGVGIPYALMNASDEANAGNYGSAALETASILPFAGNALKALKAGRKTVKAARAYTEAKNAIKAHDISVKAAKDAVDAYKDARLFGGTAKEIAIAEKEMKAAAKAADKAEVVKKAAVKTSEEARRAVTAPKSLKWGIGKEIWNIANKPATVGGLYAGGEYWLGNNWRGMRQDVNEAVNNPANNYVQLVDYSDNLNLAEGGPMNKFAYGDKLYPSNPRYGYMASTSMQPMYWTLEPTRNRQRTRYIGSPALKYPDDVNWNINPFTGTYIYPNNYVMLNGAPGATGRKLNNSNINKNTSSNAVTVRNNFAPISSVETPNAITEYNSLLEEYIPNQAAVYSEEVKDRLADSVQDRTPEDLAKVYSNPSDTTLRTPVTGNGNGNALPTWMRYAGVANALGDMFWNLAQDADKYRIRHFNPVLPDGRMHFIDPVYNPIDQNIATNNLLAQNAGTTWGLMNSGLPSGVAANSMIAADYNLGRNMGNAMTQIWDANNQRLNNVIGQRNANAQALGNFRYGINRERAGILNDAAIRNMQNDLMQQRLNFAAQQDKWNAFRDSKEALASGLAGIGKENFATNQINLNEALDYMAKNGYDVTYKGKPVSQDTAQQTTSTAAPAKTFPQLVDPKLSGYPVIGSKEWWDEARRRSQITQKNKYDSLAYLYNPYVQYKKCGGKLNKNKK